MLFVAGNHASLSGLFSLWGLKGNYNLAYAPLVNNSLECHHWGL